MKLVLNSMARLWALMLLLTMSMGYVNFDTLEKIHSRELAVLTAGASSITSATTSGITAPTETNTDSGSNHTILSVVTTCSAQESACTPASDNPSIQTSGAESNSIVTVISTEIDTECAESKTHTATLITVTRCSGEKAGCTGMILTAYPASTGVTEQFVTEVVTHTTCPHSGECTAKLTTMITSVGHPGTGTLVMPMNTGGHYANTTANAVTSFQTANPSEYSASKIPSGPSTSATYAPKFNGAKRQQFTTNKALALVAFITTFLLMM